MPVRPVHHRRDAQTVGFDARWNSSSPSKSVASSVPRFDGGAAFGYPPAASLITFSPQRLRLVPAISAARKARACTSGSIRSIKSPGRPAVGALPDPLAGGEVVIDGFDERGAQAGHRVGVEADPVGDAGDMTDEEIVLRIELDPRPVTAMLHVAHGSTPNRCRNARASRT